MYALQREKGRIENTLSLGAYPKRHFPEKQKTSSFGRDMYLRLMMACICAYSFWVKSWPFRNAAVACLAFDIRTIAYHSVLCTIRLFQCQSNNRTTTTGRNIIFRPHTGLKRYKILSLVGDGTYGLVYLAINSETREKVSNNCQTKMGYR